MKLIYLKYFIKAMARKAWRIVTRQDLMASEEEVNARFTVCEDCPHMMRGGIKRCDICGCVLALKTAFIDEICPDTPPKW